MRVLVTGSDGYIGSCLGPYLMNKGHDVVGLDTGFYRAGWLYHPFDRHFPMVIN
ncbi:MAG: NAD-dependent epimerase/dehydratase family protein, partial [Bacillota bacterium]